MGNICRYITLRKARTPGAAATRWIVENTYRDPKVIGCGTGDIRFMLESGNLGGKCADLDALFVGLARSAGIPARDVCGVRVADSATRKSLGKSGDITRAQHCRAEFYHPNFGWVPVDPADVRKVILEEERDQLLPQLAPQTGKPLGHFMYPHAEGAKGALDYYAPQNFKYQMTTREVKA